MYLKLVKNNTYFSAIVISYTHAVNVQRKLKASFVSYNTGYYVFGNLRSIQGCFVAKEILIQYIHVLFTRYSSISYDQFTTCNLYRS